MQVSPEPERYHPVLLGSTVRPQEPTSYVHAVYTHKHCSTQMYINNNNSFRFILYKYLEINIFGWGSS